MDSLDPELLKTDECNKTVYEYMVTRYHRLMSQLKNSEEQLELASTENARFKFVTKRLERTVAELSSNDVNECPGNSGFDDDAFSLEVSHIIHVCILNTNGGRHKRTLSKYGRRSNPHSFPHELIEVYTLH